MDAGAHLLGLDVGGTKIHGLLLRADGSVGAEVVRPTRPGSELILDGCLDVATACLAEAGVDAAGVGVGIPGIVDTATGHVDTAVNLGIGGFDLGPRLAERLGVRVRLENDVKAAALGAHHFLGGGDLAYVNIGTGVAAAAMIDGRLVRGPGNVAGEIGHLPVDPDAARCHCGQRGCIEVLAGGGWIARRLSVLSPAVELPDLVDAAGSGHPGARAEVERIATGIMAAIQVEVLALGIPRVVLGGGVITVAPALVGETARLIERRAAESPFLASLGLAERMVTLPPGHRVGALGAALVAAR